MDFTLKCSRSFVSFCCFVSLFIVYYLLQACILAVGKGNKVVEPVIGADGINLCMLSMPLNAKILSCF